MKFKKVIAVYGSLRKEGFNHGSLEKSKYIGTTIINGYTMYEVYSGGYPTVVKGKKGSIVVELYNITEQQIYTNIRWMEIGAGYKEENVYVKCNKKKYKTIIYVFTTKPNIAIVKDGDWIKYYKNKRR